MGMPCATLEQVSERLENAGADEPWREFQFLPGPFNHSGAPPRELTRPLWLTVFNDPTELNERGELLQLPLDCMAAVSASFPPSRTNVAAARPALLLLALLCHERLSERLQMVFQCLDINNRETIGVEALPAAATLLGTTLAHVGFLSAPPDANAVDALVSSLTAHVDASTGRLHATGFVEWGKREAKGGLLAKLARTKGGVLGKYRKPSRGTDAAHSREAHARARRKYGSGVAERHDKKLGMKLVEASKHDEARKYRDRAESSGPGFALSFPRTRSNAANVSRRCCPSRGRCQQSDAAKGIGAAVLPEDAAKKSSETVFVSPGFV